MSISVKSYAAFAANKNLKPHQIIRRHPGAKDVQIRVLHCGVCHSDIHQARNEWHNTTYPCVPGHEMVGRVISVGTKVKNFKIGDTVGVGCLVDSCRTCTACKDHLQQHCEKAPVFSYNSPDKISGGVTYGGYSQEIVVTEDFVFKIPSNLNLAAAAPLLCAGITTYSPLRRFNVGKGQRVAVVGLGGLGHMAVKFARAFGAHVTVLTTSVSKKKDAKRLGAHDAVLSSSNSQMQKLTSSFDFILDTVSADHDYNKFLSLVKRGKTMALVGAPEHPQPVASFNLIMQRRNLSGSLIGGIKETQEMLNYCGRRNIVCDIEQIAMRKINQAYGRIMKGDVKYRFVIDISTLK